MAYLLGLMAFANVLSDRRIRTGLPGTTGLSRSAIGDFGGDSVVDGDFFIFSSAFMVSSDSSGPVPVGKQHEQRSGMQANSE